MPLVPIAATRRPPVRKSRRSGELGRRARRRDKSGPRARPARRLEESRDRVRRRVPPLLDRGSGADDRKFETTHRYSSRETGPCALRSCNSADWGYRQFRQAFIAHPHHAIGCARCAGGRSFAGAVKTGGEQRRGSRSAGGIAHQSAFDDYRDGWGRCQTLTGTSNRRAENRSSDASRAPAAIIGARGLACAPASVTPLWQFALNAPGQVADWS